MEKYIYKITNKINNKVYVGQTKNPLRRWREHKLLGNMDDSTYPLYRAMKKYGIDNFLFEIIEGPIDNYDERERYWIDFYESYKNRTKGYNLTPGGEEPPILKGEESRFCVYSDELIKDIKKDIINTDKSFKQIAQEYNIDEQYVSIINCGKIRKDDSEFYPLRKSNNYTLSEQKINSIVYDLIYTTCSTEDIARNNEVDSSTVYNINYGKKKYCPLGLEYPLRFPQTKISKLLLMEIYDDILSNELKFSEIENKYNLSKSYINRINNGKIFKQDDYIYPLRSSKQRVHN